MRLAIKFSEGSSLTLSAGATVEAARSVTEQLYLNAWGPDGDADQRDEFRQVVHPAMQVVFSVGQFTYLGDGKFEWSM